MLSAIFLNGMYNPYKMDFVLFVVMELVTVGVELDVLFVFSDFFTDEKDELRMWRVAVFVVIANLLSAVLSVPIWLSGGW